MENLTKSEHTDIVKKVNNNTSLNVIGQSGRSDCSDFFAIFYDENKMYKFFNTRLEVGCTDEEDDKDMNTEDIILKIKTITYEAVVEGILEGKKIKF